MSGHSSNYKIYKTSNVMGFDTQIGINQKHLTQRTRELAIDGEPVLKLSLYLANA